MLCLQNEEKEVDKMSSILPILLESVLNASKTSEPTKRAALTKSRQIIGAHVPDIVLLLRLASDSMLHVRLDMYDPKGEETHQFKTSDLLDELLCRFCKSWASETVISWVKTMVGFEDDLRQKLAAVTPKTSRSQPGRSSPFPILAQAERLHTELIDFKNFELCLKNGTYKTRNIFYPYASQENSLTKPGTFLGDIGARLKEIEARVAKLSNSVLVEMMISNITNSQLLRDLDRPVYGTDSLYFYIPAIADRVMNPQGPAMSLEYCQMYEQTTRKTINRLRVVEAVFQDAGDESPAP
jgi:hypothetical protein